MENYKLGCVVMAAGNSVRFGRNKLLTLFQGKTLIEHTFSALPIEYFEKTAVVTQYLEIKALAEQKGFKTVINQYPEWGISHTVMLGTRMLYDCDAILYAVSDQPFLKKESITAEINFYLQNSDKIISMSCEGKRGNPCIFPKKFFNELMNLSGDKGGSTVIKNHIDDLMLFEVDKEQLFDIDKESDLNKLLNT